MITMAVLEARDSEGQVIYGASVAELAERTRGAGTEYTSWSVFEVEHAAAGTEPHKTYLGYVIDRQFVSLDEIEAEHQAEAQICGHPGSNGGTCGFVPDHEGSHRPVHVINGAEREPDCDELATEVEAEEKLASLGPTKEDIEGGFEPDDAVPRWPRWAEHQAEHGE
jgi:hypothetical protein